MHGVFKYISRIGSDVPSFLTRHAVLFPWLTIAVVFSGGLWLGPGYSVNSLFVVAILLAMWVPDARLAYRLAAVATFCCR